MMLRNVPLVVFAMVLAAGLIGCKSDGQAEDDTPTRDVLAEPVPILSYQQGPQCTIDTAMVKLVQTPAELERLACPVLDELKVNFEKNDLIVAALGPCPTGGYSINITAIQKEGDKLFVQGTSSVPDEDAMVTQAVTRPYCAVVIPKTGAAQVRSYIE